MRASRDVTLGTVPCPAIMDASPDPSASMLPILTCPRCRQALRLDQIGYVRDAPPPARPWQLQIGTVSKHCPACRVALRYTGVAPLVAIGALLLAPWPLAAAWWKPQGLAELALGAALILPVGMLLLAMRRWLGLALRDPDDAWRPHVVVRPGPAPVPVLPPALQWLRVVAPELVPWLDGARRVLLWGFVLPCCALMVAVLAAHELAGADVGRVFAIAVAALAVTYAAMTLAWVATVIAYLRLRAQGRAAAPANAWWRVREVLLVASALTMLPLLGLVLAKVAPLVSMLWSVRG
jgi:hypothetical protein